MALQSTISASRPAQSKSRLDRPELCSRVDSVEPASAVSDTRMKRLRVAFVAPSLRILGGQAVQADRLLQAWRGDPDIDAWLVPVNPVFPRALRFAHDVKYLRTIVNELTYVPLLARELARADVVHVFSAAYSSFLLAPLPAILVARAIGKPVLFNYRSGEAPDHLGRSAVARKAIAAVDKNVVPSRFLVEVFNRFGIEAAVIPNIVDLDRFPFRERDPLRPRLVSTRNFDALYNVAAAIRAFRLVQDRWPDSTLTLVGNGREEPELRRLVAELQLQHVRFVGRVEPNDIAAYYAANDIYIQSPNIDNMPTSVIEAFASGLPVVSTEAGGVPAILTHERHGLLAPLGDSETLAAHVLRLLDDPDFSRRLARTAYAACRSCTWPAVREQWLQAYRSVARENAGTRDYAPAPHASSVIES
jgi:glycosyltransferase involved in cell wall biosynthesis